MADKSYKEKWCPFVRATYADGDYMSQCGNVIGIVNIGLQRNPPAARCIGPECMAWRRPDARGPEAGGPGYCGLVSKS